MNPLTLYQDALNTVSQAVLAGDFLPYAAMIDLPYLVHTAMADLLVTTHEDLRPTFLALHAALHEQGITHYERVARAADYVPRDRIEGWHHTHLISRGERVNTPHASRQAIVRRGEAWRFSEAHYQKKADRWPMAKAVLLARFGLHAMEEAAP